jgi:ATP-dependent DNA helicase RecG
MGPDFGKLIKILSAEQGDGNRDRVVIGGLESFLQVWLTEAQSADDPADRELVAMISSRLQGYGQQSIEQRATAVRESLDGLQARRQASPGAEPPQAEQDRHAATVPPATTRPMLGLSSPLSEVSGIGATRVRRLARLGVNSIEDLIYLFPRRYDDFSQLKTISQLQYGEEVTIVGVVWEARNQKARTGMNLTKALISDGTGMVEAVWFNQPYMLRQLRQGRRVVLSGKVDQYLGRLSFQSPQWEPWRDKLVHTGRLVPVYPLTEGLSARRLRALIEAMVEKWVPKMIDSLPETLRQKCQLVDLHTALRQIHFPDDRDSLDRARHRLCFEEFLYIQLGVLGQRHVWQQCPGRAMAVDQQLLDGFVEALPFQLTSAQQRALQQIAADLQQERPMSRLLQGDVGSGKTVVALGAMLVAVTNGLQAVIMAPTEILADQHYSTLTSLLAGASDKLALQDSAAARQMSGLRVGLLTGSLSQADKDARRAQIATGELDIAVGTHALIQEEVSFKDLGLVIIDEQHRFGVAQRSALRQKGYNPHVLVMTATPIPRTLALTIYGDLDISTIDEMPPHRQKIVTRWLEPGEREQAYAFLRGQVEQGRQAFIICPLVEESEKIEAKAAVSEYKRLQNEIFPDLTLGLLHGRMSGTEKEEIMDGFRNGEFSVLVSTPVVEVGVDVPNATVMLVEGADRFGLAQLHQFRGRVGRGEHQSYCLLLAESPTFGGEQRLKIIETTLDGFLLAEEDLKMRGPGEFFGTRQSGLPDLRVAKLSDVRVLEQARQAALELFEQDPELAKPEHHALAHKVREFWGMESDLS